MKDKIQGDIQFKDADHSYTHLPTGKKLTPVSRVIETVFSTKSWDGASPEVVENARWRGVEVDNYLTEYLRLGEVTIPRDSEEDQDVANRVMVASRIYEAEFLGLPVEPQWIVYNLEHGIAGTLDFWIDSRIIADLKSTYQAEKAWTLQLGAYAEYAPRPVERAGIIHVSPKVYPSGGVWMEYDVEACRRYWRKAVEWWFETKDLAKARQ